MYVGVLYSTIRTPVYCIIYYTASPAKRTSVIVQVQVHADKVSQISYIEDPPVLRPSI